MLLVATQIYVVKKSVAIQKIVKALDFQIAMFLGNLVQNKNTILYFYGCFMDFLWIFYGCFMDFLLYDII